MKGKAFIFGLLCLISFGVTVKVLNLSSEHGVEAHSVPLAPHLEQSLSIGRFNADGYYALTNTPYHQARIFKSDSCNGRIAILAITRNAEAAGLLPVIFEEYQPRIYYLFRGEWYKEFPEIGYALRRFKSGVLRLLDLPVEREVVWGVAELQDCKLYKE